jgi:sugar lactone lactonase YvrE
MNVQENRLRVIMTVASSLLVAGIFGCSGATSVMSPTLAVADTNNNRVLVYSSPINQIDGATVVLGQTDSEHGEANRGTEKIDANTMNLPVSVAKDAKGNLYVADSGNARILIFQPPFTSGMKASVVIGQSGFTSANPSVGAEDASPTGMGSPYAVTIDSSGNLWVSDVSNSRILEYTPPFSNGMAAALEIGQTSLDTYSACETTNVPTARKLCSPQGISFDKEGNLWVADSDNNRVLEYKSPFATGMAASLEIGQPADSAFTSNSSSGPSASSFFAPVSVAFDPDGHLWVTDFGFNRVLEYAPPFTNGMAASSVIGQADFDHGSKNQDSKSPADNSLSGPWGLAFDSDGTLGVTERDNNRILFFTSPLTPGAKASGVIGQPNYTTASRNRGSSKPGGNTLEAPFGIATF